MAIKKVASLDDLRRVALGRGASVAVGGQRFNTEREKVRVQRAEPKPEPKPEPAPKVEPKQEPAIQAPAAVPAVEVRVDLQPVVETMERANAALLEKIAVATQRLLVSEVQTQVVSGWVFKINRDERGRIDTVEVKTRPVSE